MSTDQSYTVEEFARAERIGRSMLYKMWKQGIGPRFYLVGTDRRISHEARVEWQQARQAEANHATITDFHGGGAK